MRFPFAVKLALSISLLAVSVTSLSVVFLYTDTRSMVIRLMAGRLKDVGRTAAYMLESQDREGMKKMATVVRSKIKITAELRKTIADA
ncbi:MAG TPA: hypothetical protein PLD60_16140, partial [Leptospiraceae bacterium]|nr:hypothetical protein [Leptospiraceae bacterium]